MAHLISKDGFEKLKAEWQHLKYTERPAVQRRVSDAAAEGDRSENAEYTYGRMRLREIDKRLRFLDKILDKAKIVSTTEPNDGSIRFGAIVSLEETTDSFEYPSDFDTELFFKDCYGVICGTDDQAQRIVIRAYYPFINYLRTLPLHHSQKELTSTSEYADFEFYLRPTFDFLQELFSQGHEVEVLEPVSLRQEMRKAFEKVLDRYQ